MPLSVSLSLSFICLFFEIVSYFPHIVYVFLFENFSYHNFVIKLQQ